MTAVVNETAAPCDPVAPWDVFAGLKGRVWNDADLSECEDSLPARDTVKGSPCASLGVVVASIGVDVRRRDVAFAIARVPSRVHGVADPDHIVETVILGDALVENVPELLEGS